MTDHLDPNTYWEKRCNLLDQLLGNLMNRIGNNFPFMQGELSQMFTEWNKSLNLLEEEYKQDEN